MHVMRGTVLYGITAHLHTRWNEWILSLISMCFGWQILRFPDEMRGSRLFQLMDQHGGLSFFGFFLMLLASFRFVALICNGTYKPFRKYSPTVRCFAAFISGITWFCISINTDLANYHSPSVVAFFGIALIETVLCVMIAKPAGNAFAGGADE